MLRGPGGRGTRPAGLYSIRTKSSNQQDYLLDVVGGALDQQTGGYRFESYSAIPWQNCLTQHLLVSCMRSFLGKLRVLFPFRSLKGLLCMDVNIPCPTSASLHFHPLFMTKQIISVNT